MEDEFTVHIQLAYPKVSNWFALEPTIFAPGAEVKVTLLGSADTDSVTLSDRTLDVPKGNGVEK